MLRMVVHLFVLVLNGVSPTICQGVSFFSSKLATSIYNLH